MITKKDECIIDIRSNASVNMSNWQITHTVDTLTTVNNKFDILDKINALINQGVDKSNIFVTDKSFLISTNYKTYFENGNQISNDGPAIVKVANIGKIITMDYNAEISNINALFEYYKKISSLIAKNHRCRLRSFFLGEAYETLSYCDINEACEILRDGAIEQVTEIYDRHLSPDNQKRDTLIQKIVGMHEKELPKIIKKNEESALRCRKKFEYCFERFDRPIVGIYYPEQRMFEIINADQMYKNGEESANRIKLRSISKNSPVLITLAVTGVMLASIVYLTYREHTVDAQDMVDNMADIPQTDLEAIRNILSSENGNMVSIEGEREDVDPFVESLAVKNMKKLERVTDKSRVHVEVHNPVETAVQG